MHGSGEIVLAFSTANKVPRESRKMVYRVKILLDQRLDPLYEAVIEATEEAILNALCMARDMDGANGHVCRALPLADVKELVPLAGRDAPALAVRARAPAGRRPRAAGRVARGAAHRGAARGSPGDADPAARAARRRAAGGRPSRAGAPPAAGGLAGARARPRACYRGARHFPED